MKIVCGVLALAAVMTAGCASRGSSSAPGSPPSTAAVTAWSALEVGEPAYGGAFAGPFDEVVAGVAYRDGFVLVGRSKDALGRGQCSRCVGADLEWQSTDGRGWSALGEQKTHQGMLASDGTRMAFFAWQDDRSMSISTDGRAWQKLATHLPPAEYDLGIIVGSTGILMLVEKVKDLDAQGVQVVHVGAVFLRGSAQ